MTVNGYDLLNNKENDGTLSINQALSMSGSSSFVLIVDSQGEVGEVQSSVELPKEKYMKAAEMAWKTIEKGNMTFNDRQWKYDITPLSVNMIQDNGELHTLTDRLYQIVFLDVTETNQTLRNLLITLLVVGFTMLVVIFFISLYFANSAVRPIAKAWENQKQFVTDASHELKTPLSIIQANYDVLMDHPNVTIHDQMKWLHYMKVATDRMTKMITNLLELAQFEQVNAQLEMKMIHISSLIEEMEIGRA